MSANINKYPLESDEISECGTLLPTSLADYDDGSAIEIGVDASVSIGSGGGGNADSATSVACPGPGE